MASDEDQLASPTLAELYYRQGDSKKALEILADFLVMHPENEKAACRRNEIEKEFFHSATGQEGKERIRNLLTMLELVRKEKGE